MSMSISISVSISLSLHLYPRDLRLHTCLDGVGKSFPYYITLCSCGNSSYYDHYKFLALLISSAPVS